MAPPIRCDFHQEIIKPIDTPMGKNENKITSKADLKVAGSGANNWPINTKPMNVRLKALHVFAIRSNNLCIYIPFNGRTRSTLGPFSVCFRVQISFDASCSKKRWYPLSAASLKIRLRSSNVSMGRVS